VEWTERLAEQRILQAEREGAFENLSGEGKPLPPDPFFGLSDEIRLAGRVLTMCGCAPHELGLLRELNDARRRLSDPGTADEQAQRMREYSDAELRYNVAMDRHRQMFSKKPQRT
jgi:DnaJ homologue, subfamily C, member 28, conserved domain